MKFKHDIDDSDLKVIERMIIRVCATGDNIAGAIKAVADAISNKKMELK